MGTVMGMNTIERKFRTSPSPLFIPFITGGDPSLQATVEIALALQDAGADMLELGIPYSDPLADGPIIQRASARALRNKVTILDCIQLVSEMRAEGLHIPVILFTYYNPVLQFGPEKLFEKMEQAGIDGLLIPDLPVEENKEIKKLSRTFGRPLISLVAPTSDKRIAKIAAQAEGFIYCVSSLGVTGTRAKLPENIHLFLDKVKSHASVPIAVGFGISTPEQVCTLASHCDGIIVGSAIVQMIEELGEMLLDSSSRSAALEKIKMFVQTLHSGVR